jgi:hypothetical protein
MNALHPKTGKSFPVHQLSEIIEGHTPTKIQMAETKKFCHFSNHPKRPVNMGVPEISGYLSIFLYICIYIEVFLGGCVYFSERATFNNLARFLFFSLALVVWKKDRYPATFCYTLAFMRSPAWLDKWQIFLVLAIGTSLNP